MSTFDKLVWGLGIALIAGVCWWGVSMGMQADDIHKEYVDTLADNINTALDEDYTIYLNGTEIESIPDNVLRSYYSYDISFDHAGKVVVIQRIGRYR